MLQTVGVSGKVGDFCADLRRHLQERPQDFGKGVNAPLPPEAKQILKIDYEMMVHSEV